MPVLVQEHDPKPLSADERRLLTWEDATERFIDAAEIKPAEWPSRVGEFWNRLSWPIINAGEVSSSLLLTCACVSTCWRWSGGCLHGS